MILSDPYSPEDYKSRSLRSARDVLVLGIDAALLRFRETVDDVTSSEYRWDPLSKSDRQADILRPPEEKYVWRIGQNNDGIFTYDYADRTRTPSPFTTIGWIMNHIAQTADMYLYCVVSGKPVGVDRRWDDLPVPRTLPAMRKYGYTSLINVKQYLESLQDVRADDELNKFTPTPWGEMRPVYLNLWYGVIEHTLQHAMQIAVRKERIRANY